MSSNIEIVVSAIPDIAALLGSSGLSIADLDPDRTQVFAVPDADGIVIGCVGIEHYGSRALLRSLAVDPRHSGHGVAAALVEIALVRARAAGAVEAYAVTTGAEGYLERFGFERIDRAEVRGDVASSPQLTISCPENAIVMAKSLRPVVLFMCVHNAGRSQMAAALLANRAGDRVDVRSAGSEPAEQLNPAVVEAMAEIRIDISSELPKKMTFDLAREADVVVTMGCGDACPVFPGNRYLDWELVDPAGKSIEEVRLIRDEIERRVQGLIEELGITCRE